MLGIKKWFPSPLGVIFSLIILIASLATLYTSFRLLSELYSLLCYVGGWIDGDNIYIVSVSSRSYILSYLLNTLNSKLSIFSAFPSPLGVIFSLMNIECTEYQFDSIKVSVSSRSYILSYLNLDIWYQYRTS